jgi:hypothetical protein
MLTFGKCDQIELDLPVTIVLYVSNSFAYCYRLVNDIIWALSESDHNKQVPVAICIDDLWKCRKSS